MICQSATFTVNQLNFTARKFHGCQNFSIHGIFCAIKFRILLSQDYESSGGPFSTAVTVVITTKITNEIMIVNTNEITIVITNKITIVITIEVGDRAATLSYLYKLSSPTSIIITTIISFVITIIITIVISVAIMIVITVENSPPELSHKTLSWKKIPS